mmetsp:Transcript_56517/g.163917  ORF Transcript_56517/g.163917 Transcript_56517/m.163917 type:complete len:247 (+) Transcript_56517:790-1530(+)
MFVADRLFNAALHVGEALRQSGLQRFQVLVLQCRGVSHASLQRLDSIGEHGYRGLRAKLRPQPREHLGGLAGRGCAGRTCDRGDSAGSPVRLKMLQFFQTALQGDAPLIADVKLPQQPLVRRELQLHRLLLGRLPLEKLLREALEVAGGGSSLYFQLPARLLQQLLMGSPCNLLSLQRSQLPVSLILGLRKRALQLGDAVCHRRLPRLLRSQVLRQGLVPRFNGVDAMRLALCDIHRLLHVELEGA